VLSLNLPVEKQALHDIMLTFKAAGIWNTFSNIYADKVEHQEYPNRAFCRCGC
jgi:hypothetical protein